MLFLAKLHKVKVVWHSKWLVREMREIHREPRKVNGARLEEKSLQAALFSPLSPSRCL